MRSKIKRIFDFFCAALGLIILFPFFFIIAILIKRYDHGPVFFRQERIGFKGRSFKMWKFRTMIMNAEQHGGQLTIEGDVRITNIGHFLRNTKLDELPQLINVLLGQMSLVGPRPEVSAYVKLYTHEQKKVLDIIPGVTDPASICFRKENELLASAQNPHERYVKTVMPRKIRLNLRYANKATFWSDIGIIIRTVSSIISVRKSTQDNTNE